MAENCCSAGTRLLYTCSGASDLENIAFSGNKGAPVSIVIFPDFTCIHCYEASKMFDKAVVALKGK